MSKNEQLSASNVKKDTAIGQLTQDNNPPVSYLTELYVISDVVALFLGFTFAWMCALAINSVFMERGSLFLSQTYNYSQIISSSLVSAGLLLWFANSRHYSVRMPFWMETQKIISAAGFALLVDGFLQFASKQDVSRLLIILSWIFAGFAIIGTRAVTRKIANRKEIFQIPTLLIGAGATAQQTKTAIESSPEMGYKITAQVKNLPEAFLQAGGSWKSLCESHKAQHVIVALDGKDLQGTEKIMEKLSRESVSFSVAPPVQNLPVTGMVSQYFLNNNTMLLTHSRGIEQHIPQIAKRTVDIIVSGTALILLSPIMLVIAAFVRLDGGSSFFGHKRLGRGGKIFPCLKFRTMVMNGDKVLKEYLQNNPEAEVEWKATQKLQNDPRVTRLGKFLRSTSIDELPQLINVLRGDMSLVGPRPIVKDEVAHYSHDIAHYYSVRPGVTGLWQVSGRNDVSYTQRVQMDSWYVRNWSLWHDVAIICKTFPAVFKRSGAY